MWPIGWHWSPLLAISYIPAYSVRTDSELRVSNDVTVYSPAFAGTYSM